MATYYDLLGIPPDATQEDIRRALAQMARRLKQTAQWELHQDQYRKFEHTLLSPDLRLQYDEENRIRSPRKARPVPFRGAPGSQSGSPRAPGPARRGLLWLGGATLAVGVACGGWWLLGRLGQEVEVGIYLLDPATGAPAAVVLAREEAHTFPGKERPVPAALVYSLARRQAAWIGEGVLDLEFRRGGPAPRALYEEGRKAADQQDPHQSLR